MLALYSLENWLKSGRWEEAVLFSFTSGSPSRPVLRRAHLALSLASPSQVRALNGWRITWGAGHHPGAWRARAPPA
jgi:hypothetical protein